MSNRVNSPLVLVRTPAKTQLSDDIAPHRWPVFQLIDAPFFLTADADADDGDVDDVRSHKPNERGKTTTSWGRRFYLR